MSDERISQLRRLPKDAASANDVLAIVDISASQTKKIQLDDLVAAGVDLIPAAEIDLDKLDQNSTTKLGTIAIASGAITATKLGDDSSAAVQTTAPVADNFVGRGFFNNVTGNWQVFNGSEYQQVVMPSGGIGDLQVTTEKLAAGAVTTAKVSPLGASAYAAGSVGTAALADGGVTAAKIASGTITSGQIATGSIANASLGSAVVTYNKLQNASQGNVLLGRISGSGTYEEIPLTAAGRELLADATAAEQRESLGLGTLSTADGTWEDGSSFSGTSVGTNTGDQTITLTGDVAGTGTGSFATTIANDAITEVKVLDGAITESKIGNNAVAASKLADNSGVIVATSVPIGDGAFIGQQWINTNTGYEYTWTGSAWLRLQSVADITFVNSSPLTFSATLTDPFTAEITVGQSVQQATTVLAGPTAGDDAAPAYRALLPSDLPVTTAEAFGINRPGTGLAVADGIINHSNAVSSGTLNGISFDNQGHITAAVPLVAADIPDLNASKITDGEFPTDRYADDSVTGVKLADYSTAKIGETLPVADYTGQIFFNPLQKNFFLWDGNVWQPIGISVGAIIFAGTYNASGNVVQSVTTDGETIGLVVGSGLPEADGINKNYYVVVAIGGTGVAPAPATVLDPPDLLLSNGSDWFEIDVSSTFVAQTAAQVGFVPTGEIGSTTVQAAIEEVSDECRNASNITAGTLAVARGGTNLSSYTKGDLIVASGATVLAQLGVGANGQRLEADSAQPFGLKWATPTSGTVTSVTSTTAALVVASGTSTTAPSLSIASASTTASGVVMLTNSTSTTSSVLAATATAVKTVSDVANGALQASGSTSTGPLRIGTTGSLLFEGSVDNGIRTTLTAANPTSARTVTLPDETGTVITSAGSGVVTSTMILDGTIVNADINASAAIALSKLATGALPSGITVASTNIVDGTIVNADINASAAIAHDKLATIASGQVLLGNASGIPTATALSGDVTINASGVTTIASGVIVNASVASGAAIAGTKISPDFGSQTITTTGIISSALGTAATPSIAFTGDLNTGIFSPGADQVAVATNGVERVEFGNSEVVFNDAGADVDFRVEGDTNADLFKIDAGTDTVIVGGKYNIFKGFSRRPPLHRGPLFTKPMATTLEVVAGAVLNGYLYESATAVTIGSHTNNTDMAIWQHPTTGALVSDASFTTAPAGATGGSIVGGYHYIPSGRPTAFNNGSPTGAAEILEFSIWDLTWRPECPDPRGMACIDGRFWCDLYLCGSTSYAGTDFSAVPSSKIGLTIADNNAPPRIPGFYGGNGSTAYSLDGDLQPGSWMNFAEVAHSFGKRFLDWSEFSAAAFGAPEAGSRGTDPGTVIWERQSKWGLAQATGTLWSWGAGTEGNRLTTTTTYSTHTGGRGSLFAGPDGPRAVFLGGNWLNGANSGSRAARWASAPWNGFINFSARFAAGHLVSC